MAEEKKSLTAVEEAELSKAPLYRLGAKLLKNRLPVSLIATFTAVTLVMSTTELVASFTKWIKSCKDKEVERLSLGSSQEALT